ncbi:MAG TPA: hypothetical protein VF219_11565 [Vicinamibacterales bacterium]
MPLILAIEPDRRQASQLTAMVRGRLHAELVLGESAERALAALGQRVPDLILTSALLSPKDENALGERLRALDGAAAHVQTLTIPVLASSSGRGSNRAGGVLSALRRDRGKSVSVTADGCDPAVFAEQCKEYLERAETERIALAEKATAAALDAQADAFVEPSPPPQQSVVRPASGRESRKHKGEHHQSIVLPKAAEPADSFHEASEPIVQPYNDRAFERTDAYFASAPEAPIAPHVEEPMPEPVVKRKNQKTTKRGKAQAMKSVLGLSHDDNDGPASLLAAVAALEAEEHVEPIIAPIVETPPSFEAPTVAPVNTVVTPTPLYEPVVTATPVYEPLVSYMPAVEKSVIRPPVVEAAPAQSEDLFDLSSLLDGPSSNSSREASTFSDDPVVEVYELDNSLLTTSFDEAVRAETTSDGPEAPSVVSNEPRTEGRSWPVLDTLIAETEAFQPAPPSKTSAPHGPAASSAPPAREEAKPLGDILEALRRDAEQLPAVAPAPAASSSAIPAPEATSQAAGVSLSDIDVTSHDAAPADGGENPADNKKKKKSKASPAQDEWGFFDPDQCGFAALIEKLEEITDKDDTPSPRRA